MQAIYDLKKNLKQKGKRRRTEAYIWVKVNARKAYISLINSKEEIPQL